MRKDEKTGIGGKIAALRTGLLNGFQRMKYRKKLGVICFLTGMLPLNVMGIFCYQQTVRLLYTREYRAMDSALQTAVASTDTQIRVYEGLLTYLASSNVVFTIPFQDASQLVDTYSQLNYEFDVFLNSIYVLHPEVLQITVYNAQSGLAHGKQLRPVSDLEAQGWYTPEAVTAKPAWYLNEDGTLCVIQKLPEPYEKYVRSYSENCISITLDPEYFFQVLESVSSDSRVEVSSPGQLLYSFSADTLDEGRERGRRYSLTSETTLESELKNVSSYLDIQKLLHEELFDVTWQVDPGLPMVRAPNLLLQPLVENALVHGILPNKPKKGRLFLSVSRVMDQIRFTILDNGVGIPQEKLPTLLKTDSGGYGLKNVDERIRLTYGEEYGLNIQSIEGESTLVTFCIPVDGEKKVREDENRQIKEGEEKE